MPYIHIASSYEYKFTQNRDLTPSCMFPYIYSIVKPWDGSCHNVNHTLLLETFFHLVSRTPHTFGFPPISTSTHCLLLVSFHLPELWRSCCPGPQSLDLFFFYIKSSLNLLDYFHGYKYYTYINNFQVHISSFDSPLNFRFVYTADFLTSPFGCVTDMSNLA